MRALRKPLLAALLLIGTAQPALALTLDEARQQGRVGETFSGYIAARQQDGETQALVKRINAGRSVEYQRIEQPHHRSGGAYRWRKAGGARGRGRICARPQRAVDAEIKKARRHAWQSKHRANNNND